MCVCVYVISSKEEDRSCILRCYIDLPDTDLCQVWRDRCFPKWGERLGALRMGQSCQTGKVAEDQLGYNKCVLTYEKGGGPSGTEDGNERETSRVPQAKGRIQQIYTIFLLFFYILFFFKVVVLFQYLF